MNPCNVWTTLKRFCGNDNCEHCVYYKAVTQLVRQDIPVCQVFIMGLVTCERDNCAYCDQIRVVVHELANSPEAPAIESMEDIPTQEFVMGSTDGLIMMVRNFNRTVNGGINLTITSDDFQALVYALRDYCAGFGGTHGTLDAKRRDTAYEWLKELGERFGVDFQ